MNPPPPPSENPGYTPALSFLLKLNRRMYMELQAKYNTLIREIRGFNVGDMAHLFIIIYFFNFDFLPISTEGWGKVLVIIIHTYLASWIFLLVLLWVNPLYSYRPPWTIAFIFCIVMYMYMHCLPRVHRLGFLWGLLEPLCTVNLINCRHWAERRSKVTHKGQNHKHV